MIVIVMNKNVVHLTASKMPRAQICYTIFTNLNEILTKKLMTRKYRNLHEPTLKVRMRERLC